MRGVKRHPVSIVVRETKGEAAAAQAGGKDLVESEKVLAMLIVDSAGEGALGEYTNAQQIPVIGGTAQNLQTNTKLPNFFTMATTNPAGSASGVYAAEAVGATKFAAVVCAEVAACAEAGKLYQQVTSQAGIGYAGTITAAASSPNFTAECLQLLGEDTDWIQLGLAPPH